MRIITINLPQSYLNAIQTLKFSGVVNSRSEAIRDALSQFLKDELLFHADLDADRFASYLQNEEEGSEV